MGRVMAICISEQRGTQKKSVEKARFIENYGIEGDAHAGNWHRQVSLLSGEKVHDFNQRGAGVQAGAFGENIVAKGLDFRQMPLGTRLKSGEVVFEITQIGKECHNHCEIFHKVGDCIMPREGVFAVVIKGGEIAVGDELAVLDI